MLNIPAVKPYHSGMAKKRRGDERIVIDDPRAIRALAHPARLAIMEALFGGDELTATECAGITGLSPSATSYHLKALERWGVVEAGAPRADGRDRPWKATGRSIEFTSTAPGTSTAEIAVLGVFLERNRAIVADFIEREAQEQPEWRNTVELANRDYWLTSVEVRRVSDAMRQILEPYRGRSSADRPAKSRPVRVLRLIVPRSPGKSQNAKNLKVADPT